MVRIIFPSPHRLWPQISGKLSCISRATHQPQRIHPHQRVRRILIQVQPAAQPYRILRGETPHLGFVVAEQVVVQAAFVVLILPGVAQRLLIFRALPLRRAGYRLALQLASLAHHFIEINFHLCHSLSFKASPTFFIFYRYVIVSYIKKDIETQRRLKINTFASLYNVNKRIRCC